MTGVLPVAADLFGVGIAIVVFFGCFFFAALNYFAAVFYGRVDLTKRFGFRDFFRIHSNEFTAMGLLARRCVFAGIAGMGAVLVISFAAVLFVRTR